MDEFVCYNFVVDERPLAAWSLSLADDNDRFLQGLQPDFFSAHIEEKTRAINSDSDQTAALHLRLLYGHALETLFALVGAAVQAPECAAPWVLAYRTDELRRVVEGISRGELRYRRMEGPLSWENVSNKINRVEEDDPEQEVWIRSGFADAWSRFALEFVGDGFAGEQNSLKHGLRVLPGGFSTHPS